MKIFQKIKFNDVFYASVAFILPAVVLFAVFSVCGIKPSGNKSILIYDLGSQYIDFYSSWRNVLTGKANIFYSFSRSFGGDYYTLAAYYLMSPFNLLLLLFPASSVVSAVTAIYYLKIMTASFTCAMYLKKTKLFSLDIRFTPIFGCIYVFCGWAVMYSMNIIWLDALYLLPLVFWSLEHFFISRLPYAFIITLSFSIIINFYIGFMIAAFTAVYLIFLLLFLGYEKTPDLLLRYFASVLTALSVSSFIWLPAFKKLSESKLSADNLLLRFFSGGKIFTAVIIFITAGAAVLWTCTAFKKLRPGFLYRQINRNIKKVFYIASAVVFLVYAAVNFNSLLQSIRKLLPFVYNRDTPQLYIASICVLLTLFGILYSLISKKSGIGAFIWLIGASSLPLLFNPLDLILHLGQNPIGFPARYSFIISFCIILAAAYSLSVIKLDVFRGRVPSAVTMTCGIIIMTEIISNAVYGLRYNEAVYFGYYPDDSYNLVYKSANEAVKNIPDTTKRTEKTYFRYLNDSLAFGYRGITHYSSIYNSKLYSLMKNLGYASSPYWTSYFGSTPLLDDIFGISYILDLKDQSFAERNFIKRLDSHYSEDLYNKITPVKGSYIPLIDIYENADALPAAFLVSDEILNFASDKSLNPAKNQEMLLSSLCGEDFGGNLFSEQEVFLVKDKNLITVNSKAKKEGYVFVYINSMYYTPLKINLPKISTPMEDEGKGDLYNISYETSLGPYPYMLYTGKYAVDEDIKFTLTAEEEFNNDLSVQLFLLDTDYTSKIGQLQSGAAVCEFKDNKIIIDIPPSDNEKSLMFTTIPCEDGWSASLYKNKTETKAEFLSGADTFICVKTNESSRIILEYIPPMLKEGIISSATGFSLLIIFMLAEKYKWKNKITNREE